jgi:hypothetical protein
MLGSDGQSIKKFAELQPMDLPLGVCELPTVEEVFVSSSFFPTLFFLLLNKSLIHLIHPR